MDVDGLVGPRHRHYSTRPGGGTLPWAKGFRRESINRGTEEDQNYFLEVWEFDVQSYGKKIVRQLTVMGSGRSPNGRQGADSFSR